LRRQFRRCSRAIYAASSGFNNVSPAQQGWRWTYATIDLPSNDLDPRVDFGRDSSHFEIMDVNQDHLVDVVRTTGGG